MRFLFRKFLLFGGCVVLGLCAAASVEAQPLGIDVYSGSGTITWSTVKNNGYTFAWTKATEGINYIDSGLVPNETGGKAAGVYLGAYDFAHPEKNSPLTEADYFWNVASNYIKADGLTFMPMLDYETFTTPETYVGAANYGDWANQWCLAVQAKAAAVGVSVVPVIYISADNTSYLNSEDNWTIPWIASYNGEGPDSGSPWDYSSGANEIWGSGVWDLWQFTSTAKIPGVPGDSSGNCDEDVFNGNFSQMVSLLLAGQINTTNLPLNTTATAGEPATFTVNATTSGGPLAYQWRFNGSNLSGATNNTYTVTNAQTANAGYYSVMITNTTAHILNTAFLSVLGPLTNAPGSPVAPPNMVNWWAAEGNCYDIFGTNNAAPNGNLLYSSGKVGQAFHFDGLTTYLTVAGATELSPNWTACLWVYHVRSRCTSATLLGDQTYALKLEQYSNTDEVGITYSGHGDYLFSPAYAAPFNTWTHLAFVATSSGVTLYTNGVQEGTLSGSFPLPRAVLGADLLTAVAGVYADFLASQLDEVQVFNRALSASEIASIYSAGGAGLVRSPGFTGITNLASGQIQLNLVGQTGKPITLYSTTNLLTGWTSLGSISNAIGATNYIDAAANPQTYYRATQAY